MELEFILTVIIILVAINLIGLGFYSANRNEISTPVEFYRVKVNQAKVCLSCDLIYHDSEQSCPLCSEKEFFVLRSPDCFPPLTPLRIEKEVDKDGKVKTDKNGRFYYTLSMVGKAKSGFGSESDFDADKYAKYSDPKFGFASSSEQAGFAQIDFLEPPTTGTGFFNHQHRIKLGFKCGII